MASPSAPGITTANISDDSLLLLREEVICYIPDTGSPADYWVDNADISATAVGDTFTIANDGAGEAILATHPDFVKVTLTDASGTSLTGTFGVTGFYHGNRVYEIISADAATASGVATGTKMFDQVTEVKCLAIANNTTNDKLDVGLANSRIGFRRGKIESVNQVKSLIIDDGGTPKRALINTTNIDADNSAVIVGGTPAGVTLALGDKIHVIYKPSGEIDGQTGGGKMTD